MSMFVDLDLLAACNVEQDTMASYVSTILGKYRLVRSVASKLWQLCIEFVYAAQARVLLL